MKTKQPIGGHLLELHNQAVRREIERIEKDFDERHYAQRLERAKKIAEKRDAVLAK